MNRFQLIRNIFLSQGGRFIIEGENPKIDRMMKAERFDGASLNFTDGSRAIWLAREPRSNSTHILAHELGHWVDDLCEFQGRKLAEDIVYLNEMLPRYEYFYDEEIAYFSQPKELWAEVFALYIQGIRLKNRILNGHCQMMINRLG